MNEYLCIRNFGSIEDIELDNIAPLTILIGESGSGKSTIMKVLSMFRWIYKRIVLRSYVKQAGIKKTGIGIRMKTLMSTSQIDEYLKPDTEFIYRRGEYEISYRDGKLNSSIDIKPQDLSLEKICYISDKRAIIPDVLANNVDKRSVNYHLRETIDNFRIAAQYVRELPINYLNTNFRIERSSTKGDRYMICGAETDGYSIQLRNASSGTQTVASLSLIVEYFATKFKPQSALNESLFTYLQDIDRLADFSTTKNVGDISHRNVHLFIEEPELSLYPESQSALLDFLTERCFKMSHPYDMTLMMATHSPYIVNYLNVLVRRTEASAGIALSPDMVDVYEVYGGNIGSLKTRSNDKVLFDTRLMSDPIMNMYKEFNSLE